MKTFKNSNISVQAWQRVRELSEEVRALGGRLYPPGYEYRFATITEFPIPKTGWRGRDASSLDEAERLTAWLLVERDRLITSQNK